MAVHALVVRLVVVRRDEQQPVRAHVVIAAALFKLCLRAVRACAADNRNAPIHRFDDRPRNGVVLFVAHRAGFARRAESDDAVRFLLHMPLDQLSELFKIHASVRVKRRDQRNIAS